MADLTDIIQQVKRANDIVDVVGSYLELRQKGTAHWARCPFHGEKTASFCVNRNLQIYKCFGCGVSGDVVKFVQEYESLTFMEALEKLAKRANIKLPETKREHQDKDYNERKKKQDVYLQIMRETAVFYYKSYYSERGKVARDYIDARGFTADTVKKFGIGYSPDMYSLVEFLNSRGFDTEDCVKCGVLQRKNAGKGEPFDALSRRLIIPIFNMQGKVIAFGGRGITQDVIDFGKYKNTSDTPIFSKQNNLFAINIAKEQKQQAALPNIVVVEGYMDVIAMYQAGFKRAVASMGTSLTQNQAKWLSRLTDTVYICYDGDAAGQKATVRGMDILDQAGLEVKVMSVPEKLDPDEYIKKYGADAFEKLINQALPLPDYKLQLLENAFDIANPDSTKRNDALQKYVKGALIMLRQLDDVRQAQYIAEVSRKTGFSQEYIMRKLASGDNASDDVEATITQSSPETQAKYFVAACLLSGESYASIEDKPLCDTLFLSNLYDYILSCYEQGDKPTMDMLYTVCPNATQDEYDSVINVDLSAKSKKLNEQFFNECMQTIENEKLLRQRKELRDKLENLHADSPEYFVILQQIGELSGKIKKN